MKSQEMRKAFPVGTRVKIVGPYNEEEHGELTVRLLGKTGVVVGYDGEFEWFGIELDNTNYPNWFGWDEFEEVK